MKNEPIFIEKYSIAIVVDEDSQRLLSYDLQDGYIDRSSEGILEEVSQDIADELLSCNIDLHDYNITIVSNAI